MSRIRSLKPEYLTDERTADLSDRAARLFVGGLLLADDHGRLRAGTSYLFGQVFHGKGARCTDDEIEHSRSELIASGLWIVYEVRGQLYAVVASWAKHQRIDNAGKSHLPGPSDEGSRRIAANRGEPPLRPRTTDLGASTDDLGADHFVVVAGAPPDSEPPAGLRLASDIDPAIGGPASPSGKKQRPERPQPSETARLLAKGLLAAIRSHMPDEPCPPRTLDGWARDLDLAMSVDERTEEQLSRATAFAHGDSFWRSVVLSGKKLRKHCGALLAKANETARPAHVGAGRAGQARGMTPQEVWDMSETMRLAEEAQRNGSK